MKTTITTVVEFDSAHRVLGHEGKCRHLHGHRYRAEITVFSRRGTTDDIGRIIDFSIVKTLAKGWIDHHWDHNAILNENDPLVECMVPLSDASCLEVEAIDRINLGREPFLLPSNPTAEIMSAILFFVMNKLLRSHGIGVARVRLFETPNCWADFWRNTDDRPDLSSELKDWIDTRLRGQLTGEIDEI